MQDASREELEFEGLAASDDGVSCVVAAAIADDDLGFTAENVHDFAFCFVAPLRANDHECRHADVSFWCGRRASKKPTAPACEDPPACRGR